MLLSRHHSLGTSEFGPRMKALGRCSAAWGGMARRGVVLVPLFWALASTSAFGAAVSPSTPPVSSGPAPVPHRPSGVRGRIVALAASQLGYRDHGSYCTKYGPCEEWCSLFSTWAWRGAGIPIGSFPFTGSVYYWAAANTYVLRPSARPRPGDSVLFGTGPGSVGTSLHIGIVEGVYPGYLVTIEGDSRHGVRRFVVPIHHPQAVGEPGGIYAYASPVPRVRASSAGAGAARARTSSPGERTLGPAQLRRALAYQARARRLSPGDRRLNHTIALLRAFQHMPYRDGSVRIEWTGVNPSGRILVAVVSRHSPAFAQGVWQRFLARYHDSGRAYAVGYYTPPS